MLDVRKSLSHDRHDCGARDESRRSGHRQSRGRSHERGRHQRRHDPERIQGAQVPIIGPAAGGRVSRAAGVPGDPHLLRRHGVRRRLDVDRRRRDVEIDLRRSADLVDRIDRGRAERSERRSTSDRARPTSAATSPPATASTSRSTPARRGRTSGTRTARSARWSCTRRIPTSRSPPCSGTPSAPTPSAACIARSDGGKTWQQVLKKDDDTGASDVAIDPSNPSIALRRLLAGAAASVGPAERRSRQRALRVARRRRHLEAAHRARPARTASGARSASRSRRRTAAASTRSSKPKRAACSDPTTAARAGSWSTRRARCASARGTTRRSPFIPRNRERGVVSAGADAAHDRRRQDASQYVKGSRTATTTTSGSIPTNPKRMIVANDGGVDISRNGGEHMVRAAAADRAVLPRVGRHPSPVLRRRRDAGSRHRAGPERQPAGQRHCT